MGLLSALGLADPSVESAPESIRKVEDIRGVRVVRLHGQVGKEMGHEEQQVDLDAARTPGVFSRPLIFDFAGTTGWDFSTVAYLVQALRRRTPAGAKVGIINAPPQLLAELEIARIESLFRIFASEEEAIAEFSGQAPGR